MSHTPKIRIDYTDSLLSENDLIDSEVSNQENKLDNFADQIINAFIVKKQERLIDKEENEDNLISYKESEIRLIYLGIFSAFLLGIVSLVLTVLYGLQTFSTNQVIYLNATKKQEFFRHLVPQVLIMDSLGQGQVLTFIFHDIKIEPGWEFKLPRIPHDTGYYLFEDRGNIYSVPSSTKIKITAFNAFKHQIILKSDIPDNFYYSGTILRVGHFVMIFGGTYNLGNVDSESDWPCSSIPSNLTETVPSMVIWNIKRQVWFKGPYIPTTTNCIENSSGFAVNRSHGVLLIPSKSESCIQAFTISFSTFQWVTINECLIDVKMNMNYHMNQYLSRRIVSTTFMNSKQTNNLTVVILYKVTMDDNQMLFLLDYVTGKVTALEIFEPYETFKLGWSGSFPISLFTLRNSVYLVWIQEAPLNNIKLFEFSPNNTFVHKQTIQNLNMSKLLGLTGKMYKIVTVPFY